MIIFLICLFPVFGNIHAHTSYSDGCGTPFDAYNFAKSKGIKICGLTDHSHRLDETEWHNTIFWADSFTDTNFLAIYGQEVGKLNYFGHINVYGENLNEVVPEKCWYNIDSLYEYIRKTNLIGIFNHPWENHFENFKFKEKYKDFICGIEIMNKDSVYEKRCIEALSKGWELCFIASQDNHEWDWGIERNKRGRILETAFLIKNFPREEIFKTLRQRRTYAFELFPDEDTLFLEFKVDDSISGGKVFKKNPVVEVYLKAKAEVPFTKVFIFIDSLSDSIFTYSDSVEIKKYYYLSSGRHFIFAKLVQSDFDRAWCSPVFLQVQNSYIAYPVIIKENFYILNKDASIFSITGRKIKNLKDSKVKVIFFKKDEKAQKAIFLK